MALFSIAHGYSTICSFAQNEQFLDNVYKVYTKTLTSHRTLPTQSMKK